MYQRPEILLIALRICEVLCAFFAIINFNKLKETYWKYFVYYILYIAVYEVFGQYILSYFKIDSNYFFSYFAVTIQFVFFIWLYGYKSLKKFKLTVFLIIIYIFSLIPEESLSKGNYLFSSFNYIIGTLIIFYLVFLEYIKQLKNDNIILFKENKMFYINIGIILFYIGNLPFFGLYYPIMKIPEIWNSYYLYFMISNCLMYLLFAASFIWGKVKS